MNTNQSIIFGMPSINNQVRWLVLFILVLSVVFLSSCATIGRNFNLLTVNQIEVGKTTMSDVRSLFGNPSVEIDVDTWDYKRMHFGDEETETIWRYTYASGTIVSAKAKFLQIEFDKDGRVSDYYYSSDFMEDKTEEPEEKIDFDIFLAMEKIIPGKTNKAEVLNMLGNNYRIIKIKKPDTYERWHYGYTSKSETEKSSFGSVEIDKIYGKSLDIDFDFNEVVIDIRGESDFPEDKDRFFTK